MTKIKKPPKFLAIDFDIPAFKKKYGEPETYRKYIREAGAIHTYLMNWKKKKFVFEKTETAMELWERKAIKKGLRFGK